MAKVTGPAFSVGAQGALGGGICFTRCKSGHRVILSPNPRNPNSASQSAHRTLFHSGKSAWKLLSPASKAALNAEADPLQMTGYNLYIKRVLLGEISTANWVEGEYHGQVDESAGDTDTSYDPIDYGWTTNNHGNVVVGSEYPQTQRYGAGLRFKNVSIPPNASILTAHIQLASEDNFINTVIGKIVGNADNDPAVFSTIADYQARRGTSCGGANNTRRTVQESDWNFPASVQKDVYIESPDISEIIQELVDRVGYQSGKAMVLFVDDHDGRSAMAQSYCFYSWDDNPTLCAKLDITYKYLA